MNSFSELIDFMNLNGLEKWSQQIPTQISSAFNSDSHANYPIWKKAVEELPDNLHCKPYIEEGVLNFLLPNLSPSAIEIEKKLMVLHPWRKGPISINSVLIDTEWRSDMKWDRLIDHISPLEGRRILDIGCGNGYHCFRMALKNAEMVIGVDPYLLNVMQFYAIKRFSVNLPVHVLPIGIEEIPENNMAFDSVFSMGILYHRKSPFEHLQKLRGFLKKGGELILETLVIDTMDENQIFVPNGRYAKMRNVWFIPSPPAVVKWLKRAGFSDIKTIDVTTTTIREQRTTQWMHFESLQDYLDPQDNSKTVEGCPAPVRGIFTAKR